MSCWCAGVSGGDEKANTATSGLTVRAGIVDCGSNITVPFLWSGGGGVAVKETALSLEGCRYNGVLLDSYSEAARSSPV